MTELSTWMLIGLAVVGLALTVPLVGAHGGVFGPADPGPDGPQAHHGGAAVGHHAGAGHHADGVTHTEGASSAGNGTAHHPWSGTGDVRHDHARDTDPRDEALGTHSHDEAFYGNTTDSAPSTGSHPGHCGHW